MENPSAGRTFRGLDQARDHAMADETARMKPTATNPGDEAPPGTPGTGEDVCPECKGTGKIQSGTCPACGGTGKIVRAIGGA